MRTDATMPTMDEMLYNDDWKIVADDFILPCQWTSRQPRDDCYRRLWRAALAQSLIDLRSKQQLVRNAARFWFRASDNNIGSLLWVCDVLGFDPEKMAGLAMSTNTFTKRGLGGLYNGPGRGRGQVLQRAILKGDANTWTSR